MRKTNERWWYDLWPGGKRQGGWFINFFLNDTVPSPPIAHPPKKNLGYSSLHNECKVDQRGYWADFFLFLDVYFTLISSSEGSSKGKVKTESLCLLYDKVASRVNSPNLCAVTRWLLFYHIRLLLFPSKLLFIWILISDVSHFIHHLKRMGGV